MARVNCYMSASNDNRRVSLGGRGRSDSIDATFNTDNAHHSNVAIRVSAAVVGNGLTSKERMVKRDGGDQRRSLFTIELPDAEQLDEGCEVRIETSGYRFKGLLAMGAMLGAMKAAGELASGQPRKARMTMRAIKKILEERETANAAFKNVILPGGVSLATALACVEIVEQMREQGGSKN
jgi:hypothetical protein